MRYLSVCSGIEAASVAWGSLGWTAVGFSEIERFPCAVLAERFPEVVNFGDVMKIEAVDVPSIDVLIGGFPCQDLSVAGKRKGLNDDETGEATRSGLFWRIADLADGIGQRWTVLENVPGLLSSKGGADFAAVVGRMVGAGIDVPGGGWRSGGCAVGPLGLVEWAVLDAQYFGLAQRRRRVFIIRDSGDWACRPPLFLNAASLRGDSAPSRGAREVAPTIPSRSLGGGGLGTDFDCDGGLIPAVCSTLNASMAKGKNGQDVGARLPIAHSLRGEGFDSSEDGTGRGTPLVPVAYRTSGNCGAWETGDKTDALTTGTDPTSHVLAFEPRFARNGRGAPNEVVPPLKAQSGSTGKGDAAPCVATPYAVRRITCTEAERLMGFPDGWTKIKWRGKAAEDCPDGPRYKALGNSFAVPVIRWIGERIQAVHENSRIKS